MYRFKEIREALYWEYSRKDFLDDRKMKYFYHLHWQETVAAYERQFK